MLVLSRKLNQEVLIADCIQVRVLSIDGGRVRLGITAPRSLPVHRSEVAAAVANSRVQEAAAVGWSEREVDYECARTH